MYLDNNVVAGVINKNTRELHLKRKNLPSERYRVGHEKLSHLVLRTKPSAAHTRARISSHAYVDIISE